MWPFESVFNVINILTLHALPTWRMCVEDFLGCNIRMGLSVVTGYPCKWR
jgi:hypothetical protein